MITVICPRCCRPHHSDESHAEKFLKCAGCGDAVRIASPEKNVPVRQERKQSQIQFSTSYPKGGFIRAIVVLAAILSLGSGVAWLAHYSHSAVSLTSEQQPTASPIHQPADDRTSSSQMSWVYSSHKNGDELLRNGPQTGRGRLILKNGALGDAVVNLLSDGGERVIRSIFVSSGKTAALTKINPGTYEVRVAEGDGWSDQKKSFRDGFGYFAFPKQYKFAEIRRDHEIESDEITLTLYELPSGNVVKVPITRADFWPGETK